jgi:hypothetical protein
MINPSLRRAVLVGLAFLELLRYELLQACFGFRGVYRDLAGTGVSQLSKDSGWEFDLHNAMRTAMSLYFKKVLCLQESFATARLFRKYGFRADVVTGYRLDPFVGHAWVEIDGRRLDATVSYRDVLFCSRLSKV